MYHLLMQEGKQHPFCTIARCGVADHFSSIAAKTPPVSQLSLISMTTALTSRSRDASLEGSGATRERRLALFLSAPGRIDVRRRRRCASGKVKMARPSAHLASMDSASFGWRSAYAARPSGVQRRQELPPVHLGLGQGHARAEDATSAIGSHANADQHGSLANDAIDADFLRSGGYARTPARHPRSSRRETPGPS